MDLREHAESRERELVLRDVDRLDEEPTIIWMDVEPEPAVAALQIERGARVAECIRELGSDGLADQRVAEQRPVRRAGMDVASIDADVCERTRQRVDDPVLHTILDGKR